MDHRPRVSVVTVCYNSENSIETVLKSVLGQTFGDFEYVLKDGGSADGTNELIESYRAKFESRGIPFLHLTGPDGGIFDAMNRAVKECRGEWVNFMNADDRFYDEAVLERIFGKSGCPAAGILYGDALECEYGEYYYFTKNLENMERRMPFNHQACFARRELLLKFPFDTRYRIAADYNFLLDACAAGTVFEDTGQVIAVISKEGVSTVDLLHTFEETVMIQRNHGFCPYTEKQYQKKLRTVKMKQFGMNHFPGWLKYGIRKVQRLLRKQREVKGCS